MYKHIYICEPYIVISTSSKFLDGMKRLHGITNNNIIYLYPIPHSLTIAVVHISTILYISGC